jgi:hypothetical protein
LQVELNVVEKSFSDWRTCFQIVSNVSLPREAYFGFSAMTGGVSASHDILTVLVSGITSPDAITGSSTTAQTKGNENKGNRPKIDRTPLGTLFYLFMMFVVLGVMYVIWYLIYEFRNVHQQSKQQQYKRF